MNIGFCYGVKTYPHGVGGSVHGYKLVEGLVARGHRLFSWYYGCQADPRITHFRGRQLLAFLRKIDALYVRINWDGANARLSALRMLCPRGLPVVWELNGLPEEVIYCGGTEGDVARANRRLRRLARFVDVGIGVTDAIAGYLRDVLGIPRVSCIPNGSDPATFRPAPREGSAGPLEVVWIGASKFSWHDLDTPLAAAAILQQRGADVRFHIYGDPKHLPAALPPNMTCAGVTPYEELGKQLGHADVGIALFKTPGSGPLKDVLPLKLFDYMASGLAVLVQDTGQMGQLIRQREAGLLTSGTPEDLAEKILLLEGDRPLCRRLGQNGRDAVEQYYNWGRVAEETESILLELTEGNGRGGTSR